MAKTHDRSHDHQPTKSPRRAKKLKRRIRIAFWLLVGGLIIAGFSVGCDSLFYHPNDVVYFQPAELGLDHEDVRFKNADGLTLHGWWLPAQGEPRGTVIHFHGNAANITNHVVSVAWLPPRGYNVFVWDYRGYGQSEGSISRAGTVTDGHAAIDYVLSRSDVDPQRLYLYGQSLGGAVGLYVAAERKEIRAIVAEATFSDYREIATAHAQRNFFLPRPAARWLAARLISDGYDPVDVLDQIPPRPLLVIAGEDDTVCFPTLNESLFQKAGAPKDYLLVPDAAHYEAVMTGGKAVEDRIIATFEQGAQS